MNRSLFQAMAHQSVTSFNSNPNFKSGFISYQNFCFEGNLLEWQSFWGSFDSAIHSYNTLTEVQKCNYLKSLVEF